MNLRLKIAGAVSSIAMLATATSVIAQEIRVWTTETQPARLERQQKMAADYEASTGVKVQMIPVEESDYGTRATAAFAAGDNRGIGSTNKLFERCRSFGKITQSTRNVWFCGSN